MLAERWAFGRLSAGAQLAETEPWAGPVWAAVGGLYGLLVGGVGGFVCGSPARVRAGFVWGVWGVWLAGAAAAGGGLVPVAAAGLRALPPEVGTGLVWALVGAAVGLAGYTQNRRAARAPGHKAEGPLAWHPAEALGWALTVGGLAALGWLGELALLRLLPWRVTVGSVLAGADLRLVAGFGLVSGGIGLVVGLAAGIAVGGRSRVAAGLARGLGFGVLAGVGGTVFPLVVLFAGLPPEIGSAWPGAWSPAGPRSLPTR